MDDHGGMAIGSTVDVFLAPVILGASASAGAAVVGSVVFEYNVMDQRISMMDTTGTTTYA